MKKTLAILGLALASSVVLAQPGGTGPDGAPPPHKPPHFERMKDNLGLTDEQVQKMREIRDNGGSRQEMQAVLTPEQRTKMIEMRKEHKAEFGGGKGFMAQQLGLSDEQKAKMAEIRQAGGSREEMRAVLTPEQQAKFDEMRAKREGMGPKPGNKPAAQLATPNEETPAN